MSPTELPVGSADLDDAKTPDAQLAAETSTIGTGALDAKGIHFARADGPCRELLVALPRYGEGRGGAARSQTIDGYRDVNVLRVRLRMAIGERCA